MGRIPFLPLPEHRNINGMAIYKFLTDEDLDLGLNKYFRDSVTAGAEKLHIQRKCEGAAVSIIKSKLNNKYDLTKLFPSILEWDSVKAYLLGEYSYKQKRIFKALQNTTNNNPCDPASVYWVEEDPRDALLVKHAAAITAYFMLESLPPRKVPEAVQDEYADIMNWLDDCRDGHENPTWDLLPTGGSSDIPWGSNQQIDHYL